MSTCVSVQDTCVYWTVHIHHPAHCSDQCVALCDHNSSTPLLFHKRSLRLYSTCTRQRRPHLPSTSGKTTRFCCKVNRFQTLYERRGRCQALRMRSHMYTLGLLTHQWVPMTHTCHTRPSGSRTRPADGSCVRGDFDRSRVIGRATRPPQDVRRTTLRASVHARIGCAQDGRRTRRTLRETSL